MFAQTAFNIVTLNLYSKTDNNIIREMVVHVNEYEEIYNITLRNILGRTKRRFYGRSWFHSHIKVHELCAFQYSRQLWFIRYIFIEIYSS